MNGTNKTDISIPSWYPALASYTFPMSFLKLKPEEIDSLAMGEKSGKVPDEAIRRLAAPMKATPGNCFICVDSCAPTDTGRFNSKRGAIYSPQSAWRVLAGSAKVTQAAIENKVSHICVKPFRRMTMAREFRLFIKDGELVGMSQYYLIRHFKRLEKTSGRYWEKALKFFDEVKWLLPEADMAMDIYFTSDGDILIIDMNPWGLPTDPLLFRSWDIDWSAEKTIKTIPPALKISGEVNVSF